MHTLQSPFTHEDVIKKSRFIARAARVDSPEAAADFLADVREPEATHNCWAYKIGEAYRFSDDGEPGGTAGRPILAAIEGQQLDHVVVVVTRYFGGIKLGAGGLVRAYGGTAAECLRLAPRVEVKPRTTVLLRIPFDAVGQIYQLLERFSVKKQDEQYDADGVVFHLELAQDVVMAFAEAVRDATRGAARVEPIDPSADSVEFG